MAATLSMFPFASQEVRENFLSAEQLMRTCDQVWSADDKANAPIDQRPPRPASSVYCKIDHLVGLFDALRQIRSRVILVSSESDRPITNDLFAKCPPQVAHWFSTNSVVKEKKLSALPLGLANSYCGITLKASLISKSSRPFETRARWLYVNFRTTSNQAVREPVLRHFQTLRNEDWVTVQEAGLGLEPFLDEMTSHRFVLCPSGNGIDTHRLWEALYGRTIPVALAHFATDSFRDLPILFVEDFRQLTRTLLSEAYERFTAASWNWDKLFAPWWRDRIREQQEKLSKEGVLLPRRQFLREAAGARLAGLARRVFGGL
jgi:hypothetical protein